MMIYWNSRATGWRGRELIPNRFRADIESLTPASGRVAKVPAISWIPPHQSYQAIAERDFLDVVYSGNLGPCW